MACWRIERGTRSGSLRLSPSVTTDMKVRGEPVSSRTSPGRVVVVQII